MRKAQRPYTSMPSPKQGNIVLELVGEPLGFLYVVAVCTNSPNSQAAVPWGRGSLHLITVGIVASGVLLEEMDGQRSGFSLPPLLPEPWIDPENGLCCGEVPEEPVCSSQQGVGLGPESSAFKSLLNLEDEVT